MLESNQQKIYDYLDSQFIGPINGEKESLALNRNPIDLYFMGTLYPISDEQSSAISANDDESSDVSDEELKVNIQVKPSSFGISFYLSGDDAFSCKVSCGRYTKNKTESVWQRNHHVANKKINESDTDIFLFDNAVRLSSLWRPYKNGYIITVTMINNIQSEFDIENILFQAKLEVMPFSGSILPYPQQDFLSYDEEDDELAMLYRKNKTFALGHSCAANWLFKEDSKTEIETVYSEFLPKVEVKPMTTELKDLPESNSMNLQFLSEDNLTSEELKKELDWFVKQYENWAVKERKKDVGKSFEKAKERILKRVAKSIVRMRKGIDLLVKDDDVLKAFKLANRAMLMQMVHGNDFKETLDKNQKEFIRPDYFSAKYSSFLWRPFQLAFFLLVLESLVNEDSNDRSVVDLIWFPTGGGKTEAYLAVAAFELMYRRIKFGKKGGGTVVIKRYTLRLLTSQQFQRASTLICACEHLRGENSDLLGKEKFTIGLWVGEGLSPNKFKARTKYISKGSLDIFHDVRSDSYPINKFQLYKCPWCGTRIIPRTYNEDDDFYGVRADQTSFSFFCPTNSCDFHSQLPINTVDEALYKQPPSFLIGTIDKFARLAWVDKAKAFFGENNNVRPPSLIIQDELHLISGPLGSITAIYEAAIDTILKSIKAKPKTIAATATIRRADDQVKRLFGTKVNIFPSSGLDVEDSYFSEIDSNAPGRVFIGVMGQASTQVTNIVNVTAVMAQAPQELDLSNESKDAYWTQVVYHNSKKELRKTTEMSSNDIPDRIKFIAPDEDKMREINNIVELSGENKGEEITSILEQMHKTILTSPEKVIDMLPCTNIISVGIDVKRLGLMVIHGQPKTTADYIQASSRVGRDKIPGIVITVFPFGNPRNRSHYENFVPYHQSMYRFVEPTSITPYAKPARERALHAALVVLMRHAGGIGGNKDARLFNKKNQEAISLITELKERMQAADESEISGIEEDIKSFIDDWQYKVDSENNLVYSNNKLGKAYTPLLSNFEDENPKGWRTLNSMRGVDANVTIKVNGESFEED